MRIALAAVLILLPTIMMGGTLPVIAHYLASQFPEYQPALDRLYALNTFGGACGGLGASYLLTPTFGVKGTTVIACGINIAIFLCVAMVSSGSPATVPGRRGDSAKQTGPATVALRNPVAILLLGSFLTGAIALAYEVVWTHVLSFLIGNTVYAFGIMLFTFLCGLGWGARLVARRLSRPSLWPRSLAASQSLLGLTVVVMLPLWRFVPDLFEHGVSGAYDFDLVAVAALLIARVAYVAWNNHRRPHAEPLPWFRAYEPHIEVSAFCVAVLLIMPQVRNFDTTCFVLGELLRLACAFGLLIAPALLVGLSFPLLLNLYSQASAKAGRSVGGVYALNTLGTVLGSLVTGFVLLPHLGSLTTLRGCAIVNTVLGLGFALGLLGTKPPRQLVFPLAAVALAVLAVSAPPGWNMGRIARGTYAYFSRGWPAEQTLFLKEDIQGGVTSVVQTGTQRTLLSNGKFQGDNQSEVPTQIRFAFVPVLFVHGFNRALNIGLGTGNTLRAVARFPFREIDAVELAPHVVEAARLWFPDVNARVFDRDPRIHLSIADARNFLLLSRQRYDLITIEITSLWISGQADFYNRDFYQLCRAHLGEHGVLQQWVAIHHLRPRDLLVTMNTLAQVFPHAAFFLGPEHGLLIASSAPLACDYEEIERFDNDPVVRQDLEYLRIPSLWSLLGEMALYESSFRQAVSLLPSLTGLSHDFASTDFRPYLEYQSPKGLALPYDTVAQNVRLLETFREGGLPRGLEIGRLPSESERNLILGYVAEARGDRKEALDRFQGVTGPARGRAQLEAARLEFRGGAPGATAQRKPE